MPVGGHTFVGGGRSFKVTAWCNGASYSFQGVSSSHDQATELNLDVGSVFSVGLEAQRAGVKFAATLIRSSWNHSGLCGGSADRWSPGLFFLDVHQWPGVGGTISTLGGETAMCRISADIAVLV